MDAVSDSGEEDMRVCSNGLSDFADLAAPERSTGRLDGSTDICENSMNEIQVQCLIKKGDGKGFQEGG